MVLNPIEENGLDQNRKEISTFRRVFPQFLATIIQNLVELNKAIYQALPSIVIAALIGVSPELNPDETVRITGDQASWLPSLTFIGYPIGSILGAKLCDTIGRRKAIMVITFPIFILFVSLGFARSYVLICILFTILAPVFGLKEAPAIAYITEISELSIRSTLMAVMPLAASFGLTILYFLGSFLSWRAVSFTCAAFPVIILIGTFFIPESPSWLLSRNRNSEAEKSLRWLRGWTPAKTIHVELTELQNHNDNTTKKTESSDYNDLKATFLDKMKYLNQKRYIKPFVLIMSLVFFMEFSLIILWMPYVIPVLKAHGIPISANLTAVILGIIALIAHICLILTVKVFGKRRICLISTTIVVLSGYGLSIYGFILFPPGMTSFDSNGLTDMRDKVGNYGILALALVLIIQFFTKIGINGAVQLLFGEIFPFKVRSLLSGTAIGFRYIFAAISTKTYYEIETWFSLPGAILFYSTISLIGLIVMYFILPETENRSLDMIELHFADDTKGFTDIYIPITGQRSKNNPDEN